MHKNWKILLFSILTVNVVWSCKQNPPQRPTIYSNDGFMEYSKKFNKQLKDLEMDKIEKYIRNHKEDYLSTNAGFYMTRTALDSVRLVKDFDTIRFEYQISNLNDSIFYSFQETPKEPIVLGQSSIIPGIEYGLKRMSEGEKATLLVPSSLAYGVTGDNKNIGADQPLKIELILKDILNYEN